MRLLAQTLHWICFDPGTFLQPGRFTWICPAKPARIDQDYGAVREICVSLRPSITHAGTPSHLARSRPTGIP